MLPADKHLGGYESTVSTAVAIKYRQRSHLRFNSQHDVGEICLNVSVRSIIVKAGNQKDISVCEVIAAVHIVQAGGWGNGGGGFFKSAALSSRLSGDYHICAREKVSLVPFSTSLFAIDPFFN